MVVVMMMMMKVVMMSMWLGTVSSKQMLNISPEGREGGVVVVVVVEFVLVLNLDLDLACFEVSACHAVITATAMVRLRAGD
ncbi:hypothetical protein ElyMa_004421600 [Elysia marginata]|uniref:Secreted protein n=1 Tax=Elysia marginata TaxID=1093978 RepID=A0AAV4HCI0_9GAST|nr:hypothetical protein ElyMa_004421600 [Elysia marginata]